MKLLVITQVVDNKDPVLGFFHNWLLKFSTHFEKLTAICLKHGEDDLEDKVRVLSLGKEFGSSRLKYLLKFYKYVWQERNNYDAVFVHMNQEYILLAGWWWRLTGKKVYLWRNHHAGSWLTDLAASFCTKIFCTSKYSYTAKYSKTMLMPVGIDTDIFKTDGSVPKLERSILFLSRISPVKKPDLLIDALKKLADQGINFQANFYGDYLPKDLGYYEQLKSQVVNSNLNNQINFYPGVPNDKTVSIYNRNEIFVNLSSSGMYDKTIFEAMSCGCLILVCNKNLLGQIDSRLLFVEDDSVDLASKMQVILALDQIERQKLVIDLKKYAQTHHSLDLLADRLTKSILSYQYD